MIHLDGLGDVLPQLGLGDLVLELVELLLDLRPVVRDPDRLGDEGQEAVGVRPVGIPLLDGSLDLVNYLLLGDRGAELGPRHGFDQLAGIVGDSGGEVEGGEGEEAEGAADLLGGGLEAVDDAATVEEEVKLAALAAVEGESFRGLDLAGDDIDGSGEGGRGFVRGARRPGHFVQEGDHAFQVRGELGEAPALEEDVAGGVDGLEDGLHSPGDELRGRYYGGVSDRRHRRSLPST